MARVMDAAVLAELAKKNVHLLRLVEGDFDSGPLRLWTGWGTLTHDGKEWAGSGTLLAVAPAAETTRLTAEGARFVLSGVPPAVLDIAENEPYQGRPVRTWIGFIDAAGAVIGVVQEFDGRADVITAEEGGETCAIEMSAENRLVDLERPRERRYTPEDQKTAYAGDTFFDQVADLQDTEIVLE